MIYPIEITGTAKRDIASNRDWWATNRSEEQANRWYDVALDTMYALSHEAARHPFATERDLKAASIQQVAFGLGRRPTHRIVYAVRDDLVVIYRIRAFKQDALSINELS